MASSSVKLSRDQLYEEVWATPIHRLSVKYGLSDVGLAKVCKRMNIPRPPRGYWRRRETGAKVAKPHLPEASDNTQLEVVLENRGEPPKKLVVKRQPRIPIRPPEVADTLSDAHPLIVSTRERLESAKEDRGEILIPKAKRVLGIRVSRPELDRCLRLMDTLIKSWEAEGISIELLQDDGHSSLATCLCRDEEQLQITIEESVEEYDPGPTDAEKLHPKWEWKKHTACRPTGTVTLRLDGGQVGQYSRFHRRYFDRPEVPVETKARQIWSAGMEYFEKRELRAIREEQRRVAQENERIRRELEWKRRQLEREQEEQAERLRKQEQQRINELVQAAKDWTRAQQVRDFIPVCETRMREAGVADDEIAKWVSWARTAAEQIDPLDQGYPKLPLAKEAH